MEEFEQAILVSNDGSVSPAQRQQANQYLSQVVASPDGWKLACFALPRTQHDTVKFMCLQYIKRLVRYRWPELSVAADQNAVKETVLVFIRDHIAKTAHPQYINVKLGVLFVALLKKEYPERWPSAFTDLLSLCSSGGPNVIRVLCRVIGALDQDVVGFDEKRSAAEIQHNSVIKAHMRAHDLPALVECFYSVLAGCHESDPNLAVSVLKTVDKLIGWTDPQYWQAPRWLALFYPFLAHSRFRTHAVDCLYELVHKRGSSPLEKQKQMTDIGILDVLAQLPAPGNTCNGEGRNNADNDDDNDDDDGDEDEFYERVAGLIDMIGQRTIECVLDTYEPVDDPGRRAQAQAILQRTLHMALLHLNHANSKVSAEVLPCIQQFLDVLRKQVKSSGAASLTADQTAQLSGIMEVLGNRMQFPGQYAHTDPDDFEQEWDVYRKDLDKVFCKIYTLVPRQVPQWLLSKMAAAQTWQSVEMCFHLAQLLAVGCVGTRKLPSYLRDPVDGAPLQQIVHRLMTLDLSRMQRHRCVSLAYFEFNITFWRFLEAHPDLLPRVVSVYLDARGLASPDSTVRARACYLLKQLVRSFSDKLRRQLSPFVGDIISGLQAHLRQHLEQSLAPAGIQPLSLSLDNVLFLCETLGVLVGPQVAGQNSCQHTTAVLEPIRLQLDALVSAAPQWRENGVHTEAAGRRASALVSMMGNVSKAFQKHHKHVGALFVACTESILSCFALFVGGQLPGVACPDELRKQVVFFLHQMLPILKSQMVEPLTGALHTLLDSADEHTIIPTMELCCEAVLRLTDSMGPALSHRHANLFAKVSQRLFAFVQVFESQAACNSSTHNGNNAQSQGPEAASSAQLSQKRDCLKEYYKLISCMLRSSLEAVVLDLPADQFESVLQTVLSGAQGQSVQFEASVQKTCFTIAKQLIDAIKTEAQPRLVAAPHLKKFFFESLVSVMVELRAQPNFDVKNYQFVAVLHSSIHFQVSSAKYLSGLGWMDAFGSALMSRGRVSGPDAQRYCLLLTQAAQQATENSITQALDSKTRKYLQEAWLSILPPAAAVVHNGNHARR